MVGYIAGQALILLLIMKVIEQCSHRTRITDPENVRIGITEVINRMNPSMKDEYGQVYLDTYKTMVPKRMQKYMHVNLNDVSKAVHWYTTYFRPNLGIFGIRFLLLVFLL